jgi:hypothetical protein
MDQLVGVPRFLDCFVLPARNRLFLGLFALAHFLYPFQLRIQEVTQFIKLRLAGVLNCCLVVGIEKSDVCTSREEKRGHVEMSPPGSIVEGSLPGQLVHMVYTFWVGGGVPFVAYFETMSMRF